MQQLTRQRRFSVRSILMLQLAISPLFLAPLYVTFDQQAIQGRPTTTIASLLLPLLVYVLVLTASKIGKAASGSSVLVGVRWGILFGILFCSLAWAPICVWDIIKGAPD